MFADRPEGLTVVPPRTLPRLWTVREMLLGVGALVGATLLLVALFVLFRFRGGAAGIAASVLLELALGGVVLLLAARRGLSLRALGFVRPVAWGPVAAGWLGAYAILIAYFGLLRLVERAGIDTSMFSRGNPVPFRGDEGILALTVLAVTVVVLAPFGEELFFRALLYRGLRGYWAAPAALLVSGAAFGVFHLNLGVVLPYTVIGMLFAWVAEESRSLWSAILAHMLVNGVSFAVGLIAVTSR